MDVFQFLKECRKQCCCDLICSVIIVTITWEVTFYYEICCDSVFVTDCFNFCIFDSGQDVVMAAVISLSEQAPLLPSSH